MSDQYPPVVRIFGATTAAMRTLHEHEYQKRIVQASKHVASQSI